MAIRQRAIQAEDKAERRIAIMDAAEKMLLAYPERIANMAEVADAARLAKGTVYLYFPCKEELLLALHERHVDNFSTALIKLLNGGKQVHFSDVMSLTHRYLISPPLSLPLAGLCFGLMEKVIPAETAVAFKQRMAIRLQNAGAGLEKHFPSLKKGQGITLLQHSYALIVGLWQLSASSVRHIEKLEKTAHSVFAWDYPKQLELALHALWRGHLSALKKAIRQTSSLTRRSRRQSVRRAS